MNRLEKINLLKSIESGKVKADELREKHLRQVVSPNGNRYFIDGKEVSNYTYQDEFERQNKMNEICSVKIKVSLVKS